MNAPEQQVHQFDTIIGRATVIVEKIPPTYDCGGFEKVLVEIGPSADVNWTMQVHNMRLGAPPIPRPEPEDNEDWEEWE